MLAHPSPDRSRDMTNSGLVRLLLSFSVIAVFLPPAFAAPGERSMATVAALEVKPTLDGHVATDPAWRGMTPLTNFKQLQPDNGEPATQRTEVFIGFTEDALHMGVICYEDDPSQIVVSSDGFASDTFAAVFDTFRSEQSAFVFSTNPVGAEYDGQTAGGWPDWNWSTVWQVRSRIHEQGWSAEFEIPFSSLRYPSAEVQSWGVNFARVLQRNNEFAYWSPVPKQLSMYRLDLAGVIKGFEPPRQRRNLKLMPYALGRLTRAQGADSARDEDLGFDIKYSLTPSLTLDLTHNTDFAQVESDQQQVNFGRFNLFFPETRPFFLENAGAFELGSFGAQLFHSRRIGISDAGQRLPIDGGARISGKVGRSTNVGFLHMRAAADLESSAKTDFTVLRASQDLPNRSSVGFLAANRNDEERDNLAYGVDGRWGIGDYGGVSGFAARTRTPERHGDDHAYSLGGGYDSPTWSYNANYQEVGANFNPEIGFVSRTDYRNFEAFAQYTLQMEGKMNLSEWKPHASYSGYWDFDGFYESGFIHIDSWFLWRNGADIWTAVNFSHEGVKQAFNVAGAPIAAGEYDNAQFAGGINSPAGKPWRIGYFMNVGGYYNGDRTTLAPFLSYRRDETLTAQFSWNHNKIDLPGTDEFDVNLVQARLNYSFTPKIRLQTLLQYNDASEVLAANVRFSWLRSASTGLYLVYNEVDDRSGMSLRSRREFVLKYSHIFDVL